jgi:DNA-binding transcriptional ArsR family regulator
MGAVNPQATSDPAAIDEAREIVGLFRSLRRHLVRGSRAELARSGLTAAQVSVISLLGTNSEMTLGDLSRELELSHSTVSGIVDRLQAKGLVVATRAPMTGVMYRFPSPSTLPARLRHWATKARSGAWRPYSGPQPLRSGARSKRVWCYSCDSQIKPGYCLQSRNFATG